MHANIICMCSPHYIFHLQGGTPSIGQLQWEWKATITSTYTQCEITHGGTRTNSASFFQISQHGDDTALLFPNHLPKVADSAFQRTWGEGRYSNTCWQSTMSCFILLGWVKWAPLHMSAKLYFHPDIRMYIWIDPFACPKMKMAANPAALNWRQLLPAEFMALLQWHSLALSFERGGLLQEGYIRLHACPLNALNLTSKIFTEGKLG